MSFGSGKPPPRFELVTRKGCHLCDEMAAQLDVAGLQFSSLDVDQHPELLARFSEVVPVLLRDGRPVAKVRINSSKLRQLSLRRR